MFTRLASSAVLWVLGIMPLHSHAGAATLYALPPSGTASVDTTRLRSLFEAHPGDAVVVRLEAGVYSIEPTDGVFFTLAEAVTIVGDGMGRTVLKLADHVGPYDHVFFGPSSRRPSAVHIRDLTIDHNVTNNPIQTEAELFLHPRNTIRVDRGSNIALERIEVRNASDLNSFIIHEGVAELLIADCRFVNMGDNPLQVVHDHSAIYANTAHVKIMNNIFQAARANAPGARTAIETHGSHTIVTGNIITDYAVGMNVTGVSAVEDTRDVIVHGNVITGALQGIQLWSNRYDKHTDGYGLDNVIIRANIISLSQTQYHTPMASGGIFIESRSDLPLKDILIIGNVLTWESEMSEGKTNEITLGIGCNSINNLTWENVEIVDNVLTNVPLAAIRLSCSLTNARVAGNVIRNAGGSSDASIPPAYRTPIMVSAPEVHGLVVENNEISYGGESSKPSYAFFLSTRGSTEGVELRDNKVRMVGRVGGRPMEAYHVEGSLVKPLIVGVFPGFRPPAGAVRAGSRVFDPEQNVRWYVRAEGSLWSREAIGSAVPTDGTWQIGDVIWTLFPQPGAPIGFVCVTGGSPGIWKPFGATER
jgi:hypothetical protein